MSLRIIKSGVLDTIQDMGRCGWQHLGVNPSGAMDRFSAQLCNALLGKELKSPVIEFHFPSSQILFEKENIICLSGADFSATINDKPVPLHHPIAITENAVLKFSRLHFGARCYMSCLNELKLEKWMDSYSTNLKAAAGGWQGRAFQTKDIIHFIQNNTSYIKRNKNFIVLPWKAQETIDVRNEIEFIIGSEWHWLTKDAEETFQGHWFQITNDADRMGYRLAGQKMEPDTKESMLSSAASFGTIQLLPNGQLIILMADHQTTGGYPRIAHVISAHLPILAQKKPNDVIRFKMTSLEEAEKKIVNQKKYLHQLQIACKFRLEEWLNASL